MTSQPWPDESASPDPTNRASTPRSTAQPEPTPRQESEPQENPATRRESARRAYLRQVQAQLHRLHPADVNLILADLADALAEDDSADQVGIEASFGSPRDYAETARAAFTNPSALDEPRPAQARFLGLPVDLRGPTDPAVRARMWDPRHPAIFVPRLAGLGWRVNLGAVAVRLGLLRPDDCDDDVLAQIPARTRRVARAVPLALSATTLAAVALRWPHLPAVIPTSWDLSGRPRAVQPKEILLGMLALGLGPALWAQLPNDEVEDELIRNALAAWCATVAATTVTASIADARPPEGSRRHGEIVPMGVLAAGCLAFLELYLPIRAGLRHAWRRTP